jgi:protein-tyrosine phosphatase/membrane-associated phospholipid phosphatase
VTRPWRRATGWLAFLGPFFYLTYGAANALAARRQHVSSIVFEWEHRIPFVDWTIIPYWSINAFYGISLFVCATRTELDTHARRLLTAQVVAVACFILFPLRVTFQHPDTDGLPGFMFDALTSFDQPFNQAPSLHIALLVILWVLYAKHLPKPWRWPLHIWFALVGGSVLTTYQHHFFDIPTGAWLGFVCLWLWPERGVSPLARVAPATERKRVVLATRYLIGGAVVAGLAIWIGGAGLWLLWPAVSLWLVAANYALLGPDGFQKDADGRMSLAARVLLAPYLAAAFINSRSWTRREPHPVAIASGVWLGRIPSAHDTAAFANVVDLCAELPGASSAARWICVPMLDLVPPSAAGLRSAAAHIERARSEGPVLVCCALGYSRSAAAAATWLLTSRTAGTVAEAIDQVRGARPGIVVDTALRDRIATAAERAG